MLVSHSPQIAEGTAELVRQMAGEVEMSTVGGDAGGGFGTDPERILDAIESLDAGEVLVFMDLEPKTEQACAAIRRLRNDPSTSHIPVIAIAPHTREELAEGARAAGANLVVFDNAILVHLDQFLEQALQLD